MARTARAKRSAGRSAKRVFAVTAFESSTRGMFLVLSLSSADSFGVPEPGSSIDEVRAALRKEADEILERSLQGIEVDGVELESECLKVSLPASSSKQQATPSSLVVGSRGLGGFAGLLLGSVGQQCAHDAPCPVVIIPSSSAR